MQIIEKLPDLNNSKVLIVRTDKIGSILLATPFMHALREHFPSAKIDMLLASRQAQVMKYNEDIDNLYIYDKKAFLSFLPILIDLRKNKYDYVLLMSHVSKTGSNIIRFIPANKAKIVIAKIKPFFHNVFDYQLKLPNTGHMQKYYEELAQILGFSIQSSKPILPYSEKEVATMQELFPKTTEKRCIFFIGNLDLKKQGHRWQASKYAQLVEKVYNYFKEKDISAEIIVMAGTRDAPLFSEFSIISDTLYKKYIGKSIHETAALLATSDVLVCGSTGPAHMAAAVECPVLSIVSRADFIGWSPFGEKNFAVIAEDNSIHSIQVDEVFTKLTDYLEKI